MAAAEDRELGRVGLVGAGDARRRLCIARRLLERRRRLVGLCACPSVGVLVKSEVRVAEVRRFIVVLERAKGNWVCAVVIESDATFHLLACNCNLMISFDV